MNTASIAELKKELQHLSQPQLISTCLRLAKFKKANKELLHYLLLEAADEDDYIRKAKQEITERFDEMPFNSLFFTTKYIRKTLRITQQYIKYSGLDQTEIELLIFFCSGLKKSFHHWRRHQAIHSIYNRQLDKIQKVLKGLHEDLQFDYGKEIEKLQL